ncbi:MAG: 2-hydroxychromene-2-carboxylate isomerase [Pseudomonadota bacterium]
MRFYFDFASTYSYLTAMRIDDLAQENGVTVEWRPVLLGPIFKAQGWDTSPFNIYPAKGAYMWRDMERLTSARGLPFARPDRFPRNSLLAARVALVGREVGWTAAFCRAVFQAEFGEGADIADPDVIAGLLSGLGVEAPVALEAAGTTPIKSDLRAAVEEATDLGIFGAPTFVAPDGELFWGDDRLEAALDWVCHHRSNAG